MKEASKTPIKLFCFPASSPPQTAYCLWNTGQVPWLHSPRPSVAPPLLPALPGAPKGCAQTGRKALTAAVAVGMHEKPLKKASSDHPRKANRMGTQKTVSLATLCDIASKSQRLSIDLPQMFLMSPPSVFLTLACWEHSDFVRGLSGLLSDPVPGVAKAQTCLCRAWNTQTQVVSC